jgi:hypothetical protein
MSEDVFSLPNTPFSPLHNNNANNNIVGHPNNNFSPQVPFNNGAHGSNSNNSVFTFPSPPLPQNKPVAPSTPSMADLAALLQMPVQPKPQVLPMQQQQPAPQPQMPQIDLNNTELLYQLVIALNQHIIQKQQDDIKQQLHQKQQQDQSNTAAISIESLCNQFTMQLNANQQPQQIPQQQQQQQQQHTILQHQPQQQQQQQQMSSRGSTGSSLGTPSPPPGFHYHRRQAAPQVHQAPSSPDSDSEISTMSGQGSNGGPRLPIFNQLTN